LPPKICLQQGTAAILELVTKNPLGLEGQTTFPWRTTMAEGWESGEGRAQVPGLVTAVNSWLPFPNAGAPRRGRIRFEGLKATGGSVEIFIYHDDDPATFLVRLTKDPQEADIGEMAGWHLYPYTRQVQCP
jgi:hypothetical protein